MVEALLEYALIVAAIVGVGLVLRHTFRRI